MRRRTRRDLITIGGIVLVIVAVVAFNSSIQRGGLREQSEAWRRAIEQKRQASDTIMIEWDNMRKTRGTLKTGPTFDPEIKKLHETEIDIVGFMVPLYEFRDAKEFLLLPWPIECYFCATPPMRDVVYVQMKEGEKAKVVNEPVLIHGQMVLNEGPGTKFFYVVKDAAWGPADAGTMLQDLTQQQPPAEAIAHSANMQMQKEEGELRPGTAPPSASTPETSVPPAPAGQ